MANEYVETKDLQEIANDMKSVFEEMKSSVTKNQADIDAVRKSVEETKETLTKLSEEQKALKNATSPLLYDGKKLDSEYEKKFNEWLRTGKDFEKKMLSGDSDPAGGYLLPKTLHPVLIEKAKQYTPMLELATVVNLSAGDTLDVVIEGSTSFAAGIKGETESRTATTSGTFASAKIIAKNYEANPVISNQLLADNAFDIESYIARKSAESIAVAYGTDCVTGAGVEGPAGFTTETVASVLSGASAALDIATVPKLQMAVKPQYRKNGKWAANGATIAVLIGLALAKYQPIVGWNAGTGRYTMFGQDIIEMSELPDIGSAAYPLWYGDFEQACIAVVRQDVNVLRNPYLAHGFTYFYTTWRLGFKTVNTSALAKMKSNNS